MKTLWNHLTCADLTSTLAVIMLASGGTAYAATHLPKDSMTTAQVKNGSLLAADFKAGQLRDRSDPSDRS